MLWFLCLKSGSVNGDHYLIAAGTSSAEGIEPGLHGQEFLFVGSFGRQLDSDKVWHAFTATTYKFTGIAVHPHLVRTLWATEYVKSTRIILMLRTCSVTRWRLC
jgi:hypothetical protein